MFSEVLNNHSICINHFENKSPCIHGWWRRNWYSRKLRKLRRVDTRGEILIERERVLRKSRLKLSPQTKRNTCNKNLNNLVCLVCPGEYFTLGLSKKPRFPRSVQWKTSGKIFSRTDLALGYEDVSTNLLRQCRIHLGHNMRPSHP